MSIDGPTNVPARRGTTIGLRIEAETRDLLDDDASVLGRTRTEFMIETARHAAFVAALDASPVAGPRLSAPMERRPAWDR